MTVVTILKLDDRSPDFLQVPEDATVNGLFLQRPVEALSDAIRLRFGDEGEARRDAPEPDLVEEVIGPCIANRGRPSKCQAGFVIFSEPKAPLEAVCKRVAHRQPAPWSYQATTPA